MKNKCYTIGHSNYKIEYFIEILKKYKINCIVDVRSVPYSKFVPKFNKDILKNYLTENNIKYINLSNELGARKEKEELLFNDGIVNFEKVLLSEEFNIGIMRIEEEIKKDYKLAIMCSEKDPFDCHRFVLIARGLEMNGIEVEHIIDKDNKLKNIELERRLIEKYKIEYGKYDLFKKVKTYEEAIEEGYRRRNNDIGYKNNKEEN